MSYQKSSRKIAIPLKKIGLGLHRKSRSGARQRIAVAHLALIVLTCLFLALFLFLPLLCIFFEAFADGLKVFVSSLSNKDTLHALKMTLIATAISVPLNIIFGLAASWALGKFQFWGKGFLISLIDLPFAICLSFGIVFYFGTVVVEEQYTYIIRDPQYYYCDNFCYIPLCSTRTNSRDGESRNGGGTGGVCIRRQWMADFLENYVTKYQMGFALWHCSLQCARDGGIRRCCGGG